MSHRWSSSTLSITACGFNLHVQPDAGAITVPHRLTRLRPSYCHTIAAVPPSMCEATQTVTRLMCVTAIDRKHNTASGERRKSTLTSMTSIDRAGRMQPVGAHKAGLSSSSGLM